MNELNLTRITPSMLKQYETCPLSFYYNSYLGLRVPQQTMHFDFGTAIHEALDNIYDQRDDTTGWEYSDVSLAKDIFRKLFTEDKVSSHGFESNEDRLKKWEEMHKDGLAMLDAVWDSKEYLFSQGVDPREFEIPMRLTPFNPETNEKLEIPLSLRIDGINHNTKQIYEFKTSSQKYDESETRNLPQTLSYVWALYCETGQIYDVNYIVLLKNKKKDRVQFLRYEYEIADILAFDGRVRAILNKIRNREFGFNQRCSSYFCDCQKIRELLNVKK